MSFKDAKLKISRDDKGDIEIAGNRQGMELLASVCTGLSKLSDEEAKTPANHYHLAEYIGTAEPGSIPAELFLKLDW